MVSLLSCDSLYHKLLRGKIIGTFKQQDVLSFCKPLEWSCWNVMHIDRDYSCLPEPLDCGHPADVLQLYQLPDLGVK